MGSVEYIYKWVCLSVGNTEGMDGKREETGRILNVPFSLVEDQ